MKNKENTRSRDVKVVNFESEINGNVVFSGNGQFALVRHNLMEVETYDISTGLKQSRKVDQNQQNINLSTLDKKDF